MAAQPDSTGLRHLRCSALDYKNGIAGGDAFERTNRDHGAATVVHSQKYAALPPANLIATSPPGKTVSSVHNVKREPDNIGAIPEDVRKKTLSPVMSPALSPAPPPPFVPAHVAVVAAVQKNHPQQLPPIGASNLIVPAAADLQVWVYARRIAQCEGDEGAARGALVSSSMRALCGVALKGLTSALSQLALEGCVVVAKLEANSFARQRKKFSLRRALLLLSSSTLHHTRALRFASWRDYTIAAKRLAAERRERALFTTQSKDSRELRLRQHFLEEEAGRSEVVNAEHTAFRSLGRAIGPSVRALAGEFDSSRQLAGLIHNEHFDAGRIISTEKTLRAQICRAKVEGGAKLEVILIKLYPLRDRNGRMILSRYLAKFASATSSAKAVRALAVQNDASHRRIRFQQWVGIILRKRKKDATLRTAKATQLSLSTTKRLASVYMKKWLKAVDRRRIIQQIHYLEAVSTQRLALRYYKGISHKPVLRKNLKAMEVQSLGLIFAKFFGKWRRLRAIRWKALRPQQKQKRALAVLAKPTFLKWYRYLYLHLMMKTVWRSVLGVYQARWEVWSARHRCLRYLLEDNVQTHRRDRFRTLRRHATLSIRYKRAVCIIADRATSSLSRTYYTAWQAYARRCASTKQVSAMKDMRAAFLKRIVKSNTYATYRTVWSKLQLRVVRREMERRSDSMAGVNVGYGSLYSPLKYKSFCSSLRVRHFLPGDMLRTGGLAILSRMETSAPCIDVSLRLNFRLNAARANQNFSSETGKRCDATSSTGCAGA